MGRCGNAPRMTEPPLLHCEAEWELAARASSDHRYPWGKSLMDKGRHRCNVWQGRFPRNNTGKDGHVFTAPVKAFGPQNDLGLYNMIGNVWEWVHDYWTITHTAPAAGQAWDNPQGPKSGPD